MDIDLEPRRQAIEVPLKLLALNISPHGFDPLFDLVTRKLRDLIGRPQGLSESLTRFLHRLFPELKKLIQTIPKIFHETRLF
jgi:hypothetical protein